MLVAIIAPLVLSGYFELGIALVLLAVLLTFRMKKVFLWVGMLMSAVTLFLVAKGAKDYTEGVRVMERDFYGVVRTVDFLHPVPYRTMYHGGIMHGINKALTEEMEYDAPTGIVVNANLDEYKLHMIDAMPAKVVADWVEPYDIVGPFGAKGIGEPALLPASARINAAIYDALGVKVDFQPMSPLRILNAMAKK